MCSKESDAEGDLNAYAATGGVAERDLGVLPNEPLKLRRSKRGWRRKFLFGTIYCIFLLVVCETGCRLYWNIVAGVPLTRPREIVFHFYPELREPLSASQMARKNDDALNVLMLGASVFHVDYGDIELKLKAELSTALGREVNVCNVSNIGRTSLDSLERYRLLGERHFDVVIVYDGINDARMNNCPGDVFRDDYSQCDWYDRWTRLKRHPEFSYFTLPFTLESWWIDIKVRSGWGDYIPRLRPRKKWLAEAMDVKTERTFRANLQSLVSLAKDRGEPVMLFSFATYLPANYSEEMFVQRKLDYANHTTPLRIWGEAVSVAKAVDVHNRVIRQIAAEDPSVLFVDQQSLMGKSKQNFNDICHFTSEGCTAWVRNTVKGIAPSGSAPAISFRRIQSDHR